jgi:hypothetical protein
MPKRLKYLGLTENNQLFIFNGKHTTYDTFAGLPLLLFQDRITTPYSYPLPRQNREKTLRLD